MAVLDGMSCNYTFAKVETLACISTTRDKADCRADGD